MRSRGTSLVTAIVVIAALLTIGFVTAGLSSSNLLLANRGVNAQKARNLADSAISQAIARLLKDRTYRQDLAILTGEGQAAVTFDEKLDYYSTNNLDKDSSRPGWRGTVVPGQAVHLIGVGHCGGAVHRSEAIGLVSRFPFAVASSGPVRSTGGLEICSIDAAEELADGVDKLQEKHPGSMASNKDVALEGEDIQVSGDVQAAGEIVLGRNVAIGGAILANEDPVNLPKIDAGQYDPGDKAVELPRDTYAGLKIDGYSRLNRNLSIGQPGLKLDNGVLYVDGDLQVSGGITGTGAVIVTGKTSVYGSGGTVGTKSMAALISKGNVELIGSADQFQSFQGLIYTEGNMLSRYLNLAGSFVANREAGSEVSLDNTRLFHIPDAAVKFRVRPAGTPSPSPSPSPGPGSGGASGYSVVFPNGPVLASGVAVILLDKSKLRVSADGRRYELPANWKSALAWRTDGMGNQILPIGNGSELTPYMRPGQTVSSSAVDLVLYTVASSGAIDREVANLNETDPPSTPTPTPTPTPGGSPSGTPTPEPENGPVTADEIELDFSKFLQNKDQPRVLVWRDL